MRGASAVLQACTGLGRGGPAQCAPHPTLGASSITKQLTLQLSDAIASPHVCANRGGSSGGGSAHLSTPLLPPSPAQICTDSPNSWMTTGQFYAGLALAQAMPGPLFNFAAYLGAVIAQNAGVNAIIGARALVGHS